MAIVYGKCLLQIDKRADDALPYLRRAARQIPREAEANWADAQTFLAVALASSGEFEEAEQVLRVFANTRLRRAANVGSLQAHAVLAVSDDWRRGWELHEARKYIKRAVVVRGADGAPLWTGASEPATVALVDEQGLGDAVLMARWIPWLIGAAGATPRFYGRASLRRWIEAAGCEFVDCPARTNALGDAQDSPEIAEASVIPAMSLPHIAQCTGPADVPPPFAPRALLEARARRVAAGPVGGIRRVGVCWTTSGGNANKTFRFLAEQFGEVWAPLDGVEFVNLAHEARVGAKAPFGVRRFSDVYETGEALASLDVVVTVDTLIAHLAGSLGVPTLTIVPTYYDWRYRWPGERGTPFYPSLTVFRQQYGDDVSVLRRVRAHLMSILTASLPPLGEPGGSTAHQMGDTARAD